MKISIVIPAYNEELRIGKVLKELKKYNLDIIVVDDGSKDKTFKIAKKEGAIAIKHQINLGKGAALKTGCDAAFLKDADAVVMMDSDGQHKASDLPKFIDSLKSSHYDIVFGVRKWKQTGIPFVRLLGNRVAILLIKLLFGIYVSDLLCGFRGITKTCYKKIRWVSTGYSVETEMVVRTGKNKLNYCELPVETIYFNNFKGVTIGDAFPVFYDILRWRIVI